MSENYKLISDLAAKDALGLVEKGKAYGDSWKRRGGVGAFMMLARKWDRIENVCRENGYDVFTAAAEDVSDIMDDIEDLRRYLLLVQAHVLSEVRISRENGGPYTGQPQPAPSAPKIMPPSPWKSCGICGSSAGHGDLDCPFKDGPAPSAPAGPVPLPIPPAATPVPPTSATVHQQPTKLNQCKHCGALGAHAGFPCPQKQYDDRMFPCKICNCSPCECGKPTRGYVDQG